MAAADSAAVYDDHCLICHGPATALVQDHMRIISGAILTKKSRQPLADYLATHGRVSGQMLADLAAWLEEIERASQ